MVLVHSAHGGMVLDVKFLFILTGFAADLAVERTGEFLHIR